MATTAFMNLTLPDPTVTLGPTWATQLNTAMDTIDAHDHTPGKGTQIKTAGILINADLEFNNFRVTELKSTRYNDNASTLTGASNSLSLYSTFGDLYWTNSSGTAVQITDGGALVAAPGSITGYQTTSITSDIVIGPADTFTYLIVDTTVARQITLPLANSVAAGRLYIIKDASGNAQIDNITIVSAGSDTIDGTTANVTLDSNYGSWDIVGDGVDAWYVS